MSDYDDDEVSPKAREALAFVKEVEDEFPKNKHKDLLNGLYTFSEMHLWLMDVDIKDIPEAVRVWALVESVRRKGFPDSLRM